jgi:hypothetical protein
MNIAPSFTGEKIREHLFAGSKIRNEVVAYHLSKGQLICTNLSTGETWPATWSIEELVSCGRKYTIEKIHG